ncbi:uncharacterized protein LOC109726984 isoform X3 [Ananas comosus]|uniref:Uncharacterized protein LOC109726984 isoform X3 n=1 Tax=Ananas comosus TaxID=4615 RepID=A0A6P5H462_ANACO|nr:uncharacterized protein LOC109726984 isoform X3 [Ananas comosus]XP_020112407.1 uncharacterized protein LOC109726984 isoform X3 [Ananas comosus]XP_020112408.1 uncharacterized protein LOC109726984 isoform X3 [Ananas comosus]
MRGGRRLLSLSPSALSLSPSLSPARATGAGRLHAAIKGMVALDLRFYLEGPVSASCTLSREHSKAPRGKHLCNDMRSISLSEIYAVLLRISHFCLLCMVDKRPNGFTEAILMIVTSSRSSINIRHLEKATVSTRKEMLHVIGLDVWMNLKANYQTMEALKSCTCIINILQLSFETQCLVRKDIHSIAVHGLE